MAGQEKSLPLAPSAVQDALGIEHLRIGHSDSTQGAEAEAEGQIRVPGHGREQ